jgi:hypothetical protein
LAFGFQKRRDIPWLAEWLSPFPESICSMKLLSYLLSLILKFNFKFA